MSLDVDYTHIPQYQRYIVNVEEKFKYREALRNIFAITSLGNKFIQDNQVQHCHVHVSLTRVQPWKLVKEGKKDRAGSVVGLVVNVIHLAAQLLEPFMPVTSAKILAQLNVPKRCACIPHGTVLQYCSFFSPHFALVVPAGHVIDKPEVLFQLIEESKVKNRLFL